MSNRNPHELVQQIRNATENNVEFQCRNNEELSWMRRVLVPAFGVYEGPEDLGTENGFVVWIYPLPPHPPGPVPVKRVEFKIPARR